MKYRDDLSGQQNPWIVSGCQEHIQGDFAMKEIPFFLGQLLVAAAREGSPGWADLHSGFV